MTTSPYNPGDVVQVRVADYKTAGMPLVWVTGIVVDVEPRGRLFDIGIEHTPVGDDASIVSQYRVGPRGGCPRLRPWRES